MSKTVDERVVSMEFDNRRFESNVKTSMSTLDKLKKSLRLDNAAKGFEGLEAASNKVNMHGFGSAIDAVHAKFSALQIMGVTALANITNSAVNTGKRLVSALTIDPIKSGFQEYETQINAIQTILANTESKGSTLANVNDALDELNHYADKTIYNFTEMTRNIGTFTAAGIDLDTSVSAIKGIANLAAVSGSTSQQASTAMYQLSQALASGTVKLMDWNSVVNAGMGGQVFQDALKETARVHNVSIDQMIKDEGSFRETLSKGWLTSEILTETLSKFTGDLNEEQLKTMGYNEEQIKSIVKMGQTANDAATKVKTFTQLWDTLKEAAQSGWTQSWEIIVGDFEEAKTLLTSISDTVGDMLNKSAEARNKVLEEGLGNKTTDISYISKLTGMTSENVEALRKLGKETGYTSDEFKEMAESLTKGDESIQQVVKSLLEFGDSGKSVTSFISDLTGMKEEAIDELRQIGKESDYASEEFKKLSLGLAEGNESTQSVIEHLVIMSDEMSKLSGRENLIKGFTNIFKSLGNIVGSAKEAFREIFPPITGEQVYTLTQRFVEFTNKLSVSEEVADKAKRAFKGIFSIFDMFKKTVTILLKPVGQLLGSEGVGGIANAFLDAAASLGDFFTSLNAGFDTSNISGSLSKIATTISDVLKSATERIGGFGNIFSTVGHVVSSVADRIWKAVKDTFTWIADNVSASDIFAGLLGGGIFAFGKKLAGLFDTISDAISNVFGKNESKTSKLKEQFSEVLGSVHDSLESFSSGIKVASIVGIAAAVGILSASLNSISRLKAEDITKSLIAIGLMMTMLSATLRSMTKTLSKFNSKGIIKSSAALILVATSIRVLSGAMQKMSKLSLREIAKGLIAIGGGLAVMVGGLKVIGTTKVPLSTSVAMLALAVSCSILGDALKKFGEMSWDEISHGLVAMGIALSELVVSLGVLSKVGGGGALLGSVGIFIAVQSLGKLSDSLKKFGEMSWEVIGRSLTAMGGALTELGLTLGLLGKFSGFSSISASAAILIGVQGLKKLADALKKFGEMTWSEIVKGLSGMGGALGEVAVITGVLGKITGLSGLLGAGAILLGVQGLDDLASALKKFGEMNWDEIGRGLVAMGGALAELGIVSGVLGSLAPIGALVGSGSLLLAIQGLDDLSGSLKKFGEMNWDEIGRGLAAMGGALGEVALGGLINTLSGLGALSLSKIAEPLGTLADSVKKWTNIIVPEQLSEQLRTLANGVTCFTFSGFGADALATSAPAIGILADSVKKWTGVIIPEGLSQRIGSLADGIISFTFGGFGASALADAAPAIGSLADSVKKWSDVHIPENLEYDLKQIANGVQAFSFAFAGGWSIGAIVNPLDSLAGSIKNWNDISIPKNLENGLKQIANGVQAFSFAFMGGWSISAIVEPLKMLADSIKRWNDISIPEGLKDKLKSLADGVSAFSFAFMGGWSIETIAEPLSLLGISLKNWNGVSIPSNIGDKLVSLANGVKSFAGVQDFTKVANNIGTIASAAVCLSTLNFESVDSSLSRLVATIDHFVASSSTFSSLGDGAFNSFASSLKTGETQVYSAITSFSLSIMTSFSMASANMSIGIGLVAQSMMNTFANGILSGQSKAAMNFGIVLNKLVSLVTSKKKTFALSGTDVVTQFSAGITKSYLKPILSFSALLSKVVTAIKNQYGNFYNAGGYLVQGFANGITANTFIAEARARAMALAALSAAKAELGIASPSKEFYKLGSYSGQGFVNALIDFAGKSYKAGVSMAESAKIGLSASISKIANTIDSGIDSQPTIKPIMDLSNISEGASRVNNMFSALTPSVDLLSNIGAINSMMKNQNGSNDDVVSAIDKLRKDLSGAKGGDIYIDGVTYSENSDVSDAVQAIIRAAKIERRK